MHGYRLDHRSRTGTLQQPHHTHDNKTDKRQCEPIDQESAPLIRLAPRAGTE
jgi:hypothetical protein